MAEISRFFADASGDRLTTAAQFNRIIDQLLQEQSGVIRGLGNTLAVTNSGALAVDINTGSCIKSGRIYENTASVNTALDAVTPGSKRYDRIVVRVDETARTMLITVIKGVEGANPSPPAIDGTTDVLLAKILIDRSSGSYVYTLTDERVYCDGLVSKTVIAKLNGGTYSEDDLIDGTSYKRIQAAKADALNTLGSLVANNKIFVNAAGNGLEFAVGVKTITFTKDISVAGTQAITGVGFKPYWGIIFARASTNMFSIGIFAGANNTYTLLQIGAGLWTYSTGYVSHMYVDGSNYARAVLVSYDSDGLTLSWSIVGAPTGTANCYAIVGR